MIDRGRNVTDQFKIRLVSMINVSDNLHAYQPDLELIGDIPSTINHIEHDAVKVEFAEREQKILSDLKQYMHEGEQVPADWKSDRVHDIASYCNMIIDCITQLFNDFKRVRSV